MILQINREIKCTLSIGTYELTFYFLFPNNKLKILNEQNNL